LSVAYRTSILGFPRAVAAIAELEKKFEKRAQAEAE
jgi:hypothetical protein